MERFRKYLLVTLGFALAGAIGAAFGTGTAQAVVASLVQIVNPATSPVHINSVDDQGRIAYQSQVTFFALETVASSFSQLCPRIIVSWSNTSQGI